MKKATILLALTFFIALVIGSLALTRAKTATGSIMSTPVGGNWSSTATWVGGVVPTATDDVTIADAATVTIDTAAVAFSLNVGTGLIAPTTLQYEPTTARTLIVTTSVTIASNGILQSASTGTQTGHVLSVGANLTNNGVLDFSTNANTAGAGVTFTGAASNTFGGTGATTDVRTITINKGASSANVLELNTSTFTVRGATTDSTSAAYLTLTNGTLKVSGTFMAAFRTFTAAAYTIGATTGFWLNNPNYTVSGQNGSPTTNGLLRLSQGTFNIGTSSGNSMGGGGGAVFIIEGGTMNASGRFSPQSAVSYTQTAGAVNVCTVGQSSNSLGSFELFSTLSSFTMSGGTIVLHQASTAAATPFDYQVLSGTVNITGGTLQIGAGDTATNLNFRVRGNAPSMIINNTSNNKTATLVNAAGALAGNTSTIVFGDTTVSPGTTLNLNGFLFAQVGSNLFNNGTINGNTAGSRLYFAGSGAQQYGGSGVAGTNALPLQSVDFDSVGGVTVQAGTTNNLITNRIIILTGNVTNAGKLTLGAGGASTGTVQIGNTTTPTNAGSFDVPPTFNLGTGGQIISYLRTTTARTTGNEVNPTRILTSVTYDDNDVTHGLTIAGGDLTLSSTATALTLTNGRVITGINTVALSSGSATVSRTNGHVDGNFRKTYAEAANKTFEVGTANGYSPVAVDITAGAFPAVFTVKAAQGPQPNIVAPQQALQRYWTLTATGVTANLTFNYLDPTDIPVTANENNFIIIKYDGMFTAPGGTVTPATNQATISGVTSFSDWTVAEPDAPTAVDFVSFAATGYDAGTYLQWRTGFEVKNLGFNIYKDEGGRRVRINQGLVAGSALTAGQDTVLSSGRSYYWWDEGKPAPYYIEDVDVNGQRTMHGPFKVEFKGGRPPAESRAALLSQIGQGKAAITTPVVRAGRPPNRSATQWEYASRAAVKMTVREEGFYSVTQPELVAAGLDLRVDPRRLQLYVDGFEQPMLVPGEADGKFEAADRIEFYGAGQDTPQSDTRVYWLVSGLQPGRRISIINSGKIDSGKIDSGDRQGGAASFYTTVENKQRIIYFTSLLNGEQENFFGQVVSSQPTDEIVTLNHVDTNRKENALLEIGLQGVTDLPGFGDHLVGVEVNGKPIGHVAFDGRANKVEQFLIDHSLLLDGANRITLAALGGSSDVSLVDYVRLSYYHTYQADGNKLKLTAAGNGQAQTISGFTSPLVRVLNITDTGTVTEMAGRVDHNGGGYSVTVALATHGEQSLLALTGDQIKSPVQIGANRPSSWRSPSNGADLIIIITRELRSKLELLKAHRQGQGLSTAIVDIEDIYDEASYGVKSTQAVKDFLQHANLNWKKKPRFVLFVGRASYDARNYLGFGDRDLVPTKLIDTQFMEAASDDWMADFNGDGLPELAVGRLPILTTVEAETVVQKLIDYDRSSPCEEVTLVADANEGYDFESANDYLKDQLPGNLRINEIRRGRIDSQMAREQLMEALTRGQKVVNYTGHGSVELWRGNLLTSGDALAFEGAGHTSVFIMMTCLNGYFTDPLVDSLSAALLKARAGGAVAVWASSGLTSPYPQELMNVEVYRRLFGSSGSSPMIGEALKTAKSAVTDMDVRRTWILIGDPTTKLR